VTVKEHWEAFARSGRLNEVGAAQRRDMEVVFYAGAVAVFSELMKIPLLPEEQSCAAVGKVDEELRDWCDTVFPERAYEMHA